MLARCQTQQPPCSAGLSSTVPTSTHLQAHRLTTPPTSHSALILPKDALQDHQPKGRHHLLRPRRQRHALPKALRPLRPSRFPLRGPPLANPRDQRPHQRRLEQPRARRPAGGAESTQPRCAGGAQGEQRRGSAFRDGCGEACAAGEASFVAGGDGAAERGGAGEEAAEDLGAD